MIRQFTLDYKGTTLDLNQKGLFFSSPTGLGQAKTINFVNIGRAWVKCKEKYSQATIGGEMIFSTYANQKTFTDFINNANSIQNARDFRIKYETDNGAYYRDVAFVSMEKSEIGEGGVLKCPVSFICKGLWYRMVGSTGMQTTQAFITNSSKLSAGFMLTVSDFGSPSEAHISITQSTKHDMFTSFGNTSITYSSIEGECGYSGTGGGDVGFSTNEFFKMPSGTSRLDISVTNSSGNPQNFTWGIILKEEYELV